MAEGEESSPQDEGEQGEGKKRIEAGEYRLKQQGEPGPTDHDCQDQPDVVGLPHRRHGLFDYRAGPIGPRATTGEKIPDTGAILDSAGHAVGGDGEQKNERRGTSEDRRHGDDLTEPSAASSRLGPYEAPASGAPTS